MKLSRTRWVVGVLVVVVIVGGGWLFFGHNNEPRYEGRPVSYWFREYYSPQHDTDLDSNSHYDAIKALRAMGSNALPYLVQVAFSTNQDSASRTNFYKLLAKLPDSWHLPRLITRDEIRIESMRAIQEIGPTASDILPLIRTQLNETNSLHHVESLEMLSYVTNEFELVIPFLARSLHETNSTDQNIAIYELIDLGPKAGLAVPDLIEIFQNAAPEDRIRLKVTYVLRVIGSNATPAIPQLKEAFEKETNSSLRGLLASCLYTVDPKQTFAFDYLIGLLTNDATSKQICIAADGLSGIGLNATSSIPILLNVSKTTNCDLDAMYSVLHTLKVLGASDDQVLPVLKLKLDSDSMKLREFAFSHIGYLDHGEQEAEAALEDMIRRHSKNENWAIVELGSMRPRPRAAIPVLEQEMNGTNKELSATARSVLLQIDPAAAVK